MDLLIEIGNTNLKYTFLENKKYTFKNQLFIDTNLSQLLPFKEGISSVFIANVNDDSCLKEVTTFYQNQGVTVNIITQKTHPYIDNQYDDLERLGSDRWLHIVGAWINENKSSIVISAGTAITIDFLEEVSSDKFVYQGGMILPGIHLSLSALNHSTKNINALLGKSDYPASNTDDSVTTGILYSIMGAVNLVCRTRKPDIPILLTGGGADWIYKHADKDWRSKIKLKENLLFDGMRAYI